MYYVYILRSIKFNRLYIGYTANLQSRFCFHNKGRVFATKPYTPWILISYEAYIERADAKRREIYLKSTKGRTTIKTMLKDYFNK